MSFPTGRAGLKCSLEPHSTPLTQHFFKATMSRPEHQAPPEIYYGDTEARKYTAKYVDEAKTVHETKRFRQI